MQTIKQNKKIAVIIPSFRVKKHILKVIEGLDNLIEIIIVVDDQCPEASGKHVEELCKDPRVHVYYNQVNLGVGGATINGYRKALELGADILIKVDGDGQMDPGKIPDLIKPIITGEADYTKGNRFYFLTELKRMPKMRLFGNSMLSLISKIVTGYWNITDPTNGYTALNGKILKYLTLDKINKRYFFESDMLFRLATCRAVVQDIPMHPKYEDETSSLSILNTALKFPFLYFVRFVKRLFYNYFLRDFNIGTIHLLFGLFLFSFGVIFGSIAWYHSVSSGHLASTGTVMVSVLPIILGFQMLLSFISYDIQNQPTKPLSEVD